MPATYKTACTSLNLQAYHTNKFRTLHADTKIYACTINDHARAGILYCIIMHAYVCICAVPSYQYNFALPVCETTFETWADSYTVRTK